MQTDGVRIFKLHFFPFIFKYGIFFSNLTTSSFHEYESDLRSNEHYLSSSEKKT